MKRRIAHLQYIRRLTGPGRPGIDSIEGLAAPRMDWKLSLIHISVFKKAAKEEMNDSLEFCPAPYDFHGMYLFLKKKAGTRREFRRLLAAMLEAVSYTHLY